jgi:GTPase
MPTTEKQRIIAIVGRPNVGKSAIFNRIVGREVSIVHSESGVTRDRLMRDASWENQYFNIIDTGGLCNLDSARSQDVIAQGIRHQIEAALDDAAVAVFVTDIRAGLHPMDLEVARLLRERSLPTFVACNKADSEKDDGRVSEFERLGFETYPVSALHNRGFQSLMTSAVAKLPPVSASVANPPRLKVAILGRPNVGKSSYLNALLKCNRLIVSNIPGTTHDCVEIPFTIGKGSSARHYILADTPGLRQSGKITEAVEKFGGVRAEKILSQFDVAILVIDALQGPTAFEKHIAAMIEEYRRNCILLVTKWDLATDATQREYTKALWRVFPFMDHCPLVYVSAVSGYNIRRSVDTIDAVARNSQRTLPTGILNRVIADAQEKISAPSISGKHLRIYYAVQVSTSPQTIRLFVNDPKLAVPAYEEYLANALRSRFELEGVHLKLQFAARQNKIS